MLLFFVRQVTVSLHHQINIFFHLIPAKKYLLMVRIMFKCQPLAVVVKPATASVQIGVRTSTGTVRCIFFGKRFCPEFSVRLCLINLPNPKLAVFKVRTSPQCFFNISL